jgi:uroporphyrinogen decarboxylase
MNAYERTLAAIYGEAYDRTPVIPHVIQHAMKVTGIPHSVYSSDGAKMARAQVETLRRYGYDGFTITTDNQIITEAMGCTIELPYDEPPKYVRRVLGNKEDLSVLKDFDPFKDARMPVILKALRIARETLGDEYFIKVNFDSAPFAVAAALMGEEKFFVVMLDDERYAMDLLGICTKAVVKYAKAIISEGAHGITCGDSTAGLIGRELYRKFAFPYEKEIFDKLKTEGVPAFLHICGDTRNIVDLMVDTGADVLELDSNISFYEAYEKTGRKVCLQGNVPTITAMLQGTPKVVYEAGIDCILASKGKKLILGTGCEVPRDTPPENIHALVRAGAEGALGGL